VGPNQVLAPSSTHHFPGATLTDLDDDGLPELIVTGDGSTPSNRFRCAMIYDIECGEAGRRAS
jgi:hypothetical protein